MTQLSRLNFAPRPISTWKCKTASACGILRLRSRVGKQPVKNEGRQAVGSECPVHTRCPCAMKSKDCPIATSATTLATVTPTPNRTSKYSFSGIKNCERSLWKSAFRPTRKARKRRDGNAHVDRTWQSVARTSRLHLSPRQTTEQFCGPRR